MLLQSFIPFFHIFQTEHFQAPFPSSFTPDQFVNLTEAAGIHKAHLKVTITSDCKESQPANDFPEGDKMAVISSNKMTVCRSHLG